MGKKIDHEPIILVEGKYNISDVEKLRTVQSIFREYDIYPEQLKEVFEIDNPSLKKNDREYITGVNELLLNRNDTISGNWVYTPWNGLLVHMVGEEDYIKLKTNRNRNLITIEEQQKLYESCVGIVGLSVGSHIATSLAAQGVAKNLKLAEFDTLETTNLNRIRASYYQVGMPKLQIASQSIYETNPYTRIYPYPMGLNKDTLDIFINRDPKPQIIFEVIDDFEMKILLRLVARKHGIPVIMFSNLGDSVMIDVERYDLDPSLALFNGLLGNLPEEILNRPITDQIKHEYAVKMVGIENVPIKALESVKEIGKSLVGRPQLSSTVTISGAIATYYVRNYILNGHLPSGRALVKFEDIFTF